MSVSHNKHPFFTKMSSVKYYYIAAHVLMGSSSLRNFSAVTQKYIFEKERGKTCMKKKIPWCLGP